MGKPGGPEDPDDGDDGDSNTGLTISFKLVDNTGQECHMQDSTGQAQSM